MNTSKREKRLWNEFYKHIEHNNKEKVKESKRNLEHCLLDRFIKRYNKKGEYKKPLREVELYERYNNTTDHDPDPENRPKLIKALIEVLFEKRERIYRRFKSNINIDNG